jgi:hypothetical protein
MSAILHDLQRRCSTSALRLTTTQRSTDSQPEAVLTDPTPPRVAGRPDSLVASDRG